MFAKEISDVKRVNFLVEHLNYAAVIFQYAAVIFQYAAVIFRYAPCIIPVKMKIAVNYSFTAI
ncbi:MAG: hypothetical protein LBV64_02110 [Mediterranea sp.]|jgi:hypothetical protein|nr:hypothetical protein [Mediterranea sp.]